jgi:hypothetical protein
MGTKTLIKINMPLITAEYVGNKHTNNITSHKPRAVLQGTYLFTQTHISAKKNNKF